MRIAEAEALDVAELGRLVWLDTFGVTPGPEAMGTFAEDLAEWWSSHETTHHAFVARGDGREVVGMAWLALLPRVPRPGHVDRFSADIQTVFVEEAHRGNGIGSALVQATIDHAARLGAIRVTVHSGRRAVPVYERLGFGSSRRLLQLPRD